MLDPLELAKKDLESSIRDFRSASDAASPSFAYFKAAERALVGLERLRLHERSLRARYSELDWLTEVDDKPEIGTHTSEEHRRIADRLRTTAAAAMYRGREEAVRPFDYDQAAKQLRFIREARGLTQADIAAKVGLTPQAISMVESGKRRLTIDKMQIWARECGYGFVTKLVNVGPNTPRPAKEEILTLLDALSEKQANRVMEFVRSLVLTDHLDDGRAWDAVRVMQRGESLQQRAASAAILMPVGSENNEQVMALLSHEGWLPDKPSSE